MAYISQSVDSCVCLHVGFAPLMLYRVEEQTDLTREPDQTWPTSVRDIASAPVGIGAH